MVKSALPVLDIQADIALLSALTVAAVQVEKDQREDGQGDRLLPGDDQGQGQITGGIVWGSLTPSSLSILLSLSLLIGCWSFCLCHHCPTGGPISWVCRKHSTPQHCLTASHHRAVCDLCHSLSAIEVRVSELIHWEKSGYCKALKALLVAMRFLCLMVLFFQSESRYCLVYSF